MDWNSWIPIITLILGFALGFISEIIKSSTELSRTYKEIIFRKRLDEIEEILPVIRELRFSLFTDEYEKFPLIMKSEKALNEYKIKISGLLKSSCSFWISNEIRSSLGSLQQYLFHLMKHVRNLSNEERIKIGIAIDSDFSEFYLVLLNMMTRFYLGRP